MLNAKKIEEINNAALAKFRRENNGKDGVVPSEYLLNPLTAEIISDINASKIEKRKVMSGQTTYILSNLATDDRVILYEIGKFKKKYNLEINGQSHIVFSDNYAKQISGALNAKLELQKNESKIPLWQRNQGAEI